jgi:glycosyltransferase involved in cell wall biosynthesis
MNISVILCTFNRSQSLAKALESLAKSSLGGEVEWEVLVIDNNSTDGTRQVAETFCQQYPTHFRYVFEPNAGKSHALNRGVLEAHGDVLAFTDDDVTVEPTWIQNLTANLNNGSWAGAGGRTLPEQPFQAPSWISFRRRHALAPLALFDPALAAGPLDEAPYGVNMAFQRKAFERYGGFRTDLGPGLGSGSPQKSEDSEFGDRLLASGERLRYEPFALVYHSVPAGRLKKSYFLAWWFDKARSDRLACGTSPKTSWTVAGIPLRLFGRLGRWTLNWLITMDPSLRFEYKINVWANCGEIVECYRQSRLGTKRAKG